MPVLVALCQQPLAAAAPREFLEVVRPRVDELARRRQISLACRTLPKFRRRFAVCTRVGAWRGAAGAGTKIVAASLAASLALVDFAAERGQRPSAGRVVSDDPGRASSPTGMSRATSSREGPPWPVCPGPRKALTHAGRVNKPAATRAGGSTHVRPTQKIA